MKIQGPLTGQTAPQNEVQSSPIRTSTNTAAASEQTDAQAAQQVELAGTEAITASLKQLATLLKGSRTAALPQQVQEQIAQLLSQSSTDTADISQGIFTLLRSQKNVAEMLTAFSQDLSAASVATMPEEQMLINKLLTLFTQATEALLPDPASTETAAAEARPQQQQVGNRASNSDGSLLPGDVPAKMTANAAPNTPVTQVAAKQSSAGAGTEGTTGQPSGAGAAAARTVLPETAVVDGPVMTQAETDGQEPVLPQRSEVKPDGQASLPANRPESEHTLRRSANIADTANEKIDGARQGRNTLSSPEEGTSAPAEQKTAMYRSGRQEETLGANGGNSQEMGQAQGRGLKQSATLVEQQLGQNGAGIGETMTEAGQQSTSAQRPVQEDVRLSERDVLKAGTDPNHAERLAEQKSQPAQGQAELFMARTLLQDTEGLLLAAKQLLTLQPPPDGSDLNKEIRQVLQQVKDDLLPAEQDNMKKMLTDMQSFMPAAIRQAAQQLNLPQLPDLWAVLQLKHAKEWEGVEPELLEKSATSIRDMANSLQKNLAVQVEKNEQATMFSFNMSLHSSDGTLYPAHIHIYHERQRQNQNGVELPADTWMRVAVDTEYAGAVKLTFHLQQGQLLQIKTEFSSDTAADGFKEELPALIKQLSGLPFQLTDFRVMAAEGDE